MLHFIGDFLYNQNGRRSIAGLGLMYKARASLARAVLKRDFLSIEIHPFVSLARAAFYRGFL